MYAFANDPDGLQVISPVLPFPSIYQDVSELPIQILV